MQTLLTKLKQTELEKKIFHLSYPVLKKVTQMNFPRCCQIKTRQRTRKKNWTVWNTKRLARHWKKLQLRRQTRKICLRSKETTGGQLLSMLVVSSTDLRYQIFLNIQRLGWERFSGPGLPTRSWSTATVTSLATLPWYFSTETTRTLTPSLTAIEWASFMSAPRTAPWSHRQV